MVPVSVPRLGEEARGSGARPPSRSFSTVVVTRPADRGQTLGRAEFEPRGCWTHRLPWHESAFLGQPGSWAVLC